MPSPTVLSCFADQDRRLLDRLADQLVCSRSDAVRLGLAALRDDPVRRRQVRAERIGRALLQTLRDQHGAEAPELIRIARELGFRPASKPWFIAEPGAPAAPLGAVGTPALACDPIDLLELVGEQHVARGGQGGVGSDGPRRRAWRVLSSSESTSSSSTSGYPASKARLHGPEASESERATRWMALSTRSVQGASGGH